MLDFFRLDIPSQALSDMFAWGSQNGWVLIPIAGIIWFIVSEITEEKTKRHRRELIHRERIMAMDKGMEARLEEAIRSDAEREDRDHTGLLIGGIITVGAGIGLSIFLAILNEPHERRVVAVGIIPIFVGIALLVSWWAARRFGTNSRDSQ